jgi:hypothetical protein
MSKYKCDNNNKCEEVSLFITINKPKHKNNLKNVKIEFDTSVTQILKIVVWSILLSIIIDKLVRPTILKRLNIN